MKVSSRSKENNICMQNTKDKSTPKTRNLKPLADTTNKKVTKFIHRGCLQLRSNVSRGHSSFAEEDTAVKSKDARSSINKMETRSTTAKKPLLVSSIQRQETFNRKKVVVNKVTKFKQNKLTNKIVESELDYMKSAYVLIERCAEIEKQYRKRFLLTSPIEKLPRRSSNPLAVYDFEYDKSKEPKQKRKRKRAHLKKETKKVLPFEIFGMNQPRKLKTKKIQKKVSNSDVVQPLTMVLRKRNTKLPEVNKYIETSTFLTELKKSDLDFDGIKEAFDKLLDKKNVGASNNNVQENIGTQNDDVEVIFEDAVPSPVPSLEPSDKAQIVNKPINIVEEVTKSFMEDCEPEELDNAKKVLSPIKILSNIQVKKPVKIYKNRNPKKEIFSSTLNYSVEQPIPWRLDISSIRRSYLLDLKNKSLSKQNTVNATKKTTATKSRGSDDGTGNNGKENKPATVPPLVNRNSVVNYEVPKPNKSSDEEISKQNTEDGITNNEENSPKQKHSYQTSILDFITISRPAATKNLSAKMDSLFENSIIENTVTPRKVLGNFNYVQSTPLKPHNSVTTYESPNISRIEPAKDNQDIDNLFGFASELDSDKENQPNKISPNKQNKLTAIQKPTRFPPREIKRTLFPEVVEQNEKVPEIREPGVVSDTADVSPPASVDASILLFEDIDTSSFSKRPIRRYERKTPKRRRLPSVESFDSEPESPDLHVKKKRKDAPTKQEKEEADRLASHYNYMFEEIEKHTLCIE